MGWVSGKMISKMEKAARNGPMAQGTRGNTEVGARMAQGLLHGLTVQPTLAHLWRTTSTALACIDGRMAAATLDNGNQTECMDVGSSLGPTEEHTMANTAMTSRTGMVFSDGQMAANTRANGEKESNMAAAPTRLLAAISRP